MEIEYLVSQILRATIAHAEAALKIYEEIGDANSKQVQEQLGKWNRERALDDAQSA